MTKTMFIRIFGFLTLLSLSSVRAQVNPVYKRMVQNGWNYPFGNGFRRLTPTEVKSEFFKSMGYGDSTLTELKKNGVNMGKLWNRGAAFNRKTWTALSDCIVIGNVSRIEHPSWPRPRYHTVAYVKVDSFLRNDYDLSKGQLAVLEMSGPTGKPGEGEVAIGEKTLRIGEQVLLFLSASQLILFAVNNNMQNLYNQLTNSPKLRFQLIARLDIKSGQVVISGKQTALTQVAREADSIVNLIGHPVPTRKEL